MLESRHQHRATTSASLATVWNRLQDPATWATVAGVDGTNEHRFNGSSLVSFGFQAMIGGVPYRGRARVVESQPHTSMTLSIKSSEVLGTITVSPMTTPSGVEVDVTMVMRPAGMLGAVAFPVVTAAVSRNFTDSVERLAAELSED
jgi:carbon monoxide dehydrogenase subunit G